MSRFGRYAVGMQTAWPPPVNGEAGNSFTVEVKSKFGFEAIKISNFSDKRANEEMTSSNLHFNEHQALKHAGKLLERIGTAHKSGLSKRANNLSRKYLKSHDARCLAILEASKALRKKGKPIPPKKQLLELAGELDAWKGTDEIAYVNFKPKAGNENDFRPIIDFGIKNRALQFLVLPVLKSRADLLPNQFYTRGGIPAALESILEALNAGFRHVKEIDIERCFSSFDGDSLPELLHIPKGVAERVISSRHFNFVPRNSNLLFDPDIWSSPGKMDIYPSWLAKDIAAVQQGIPQGSHASPLVSEMLLSDLISHLPKCGKVVNYADNFWIMGQEEKDLATMEKALRCEFMTHPVGPLKSNPIKSYSPGETILLLGHQIKSTGKAFSTGPSPQNLYKFKTKFCNRIEEIQKNEKGSAQQKLKKKSQKRLIEYVKSWVAGFSFWAEAPSFREKYLGRIAKAEGVNNAQKI